MCAYICAHVFLLSDVVLAKKWDGEEGSNTEGVGRREDNVNIHVMKTEGRISWKEDRKQLKCRREHGEGNGIK